MTPKRPIRRIRGAATPERPKQNNADATGASVRATSSRHRATMASSDFTLPHATKDFLPRRKLGRDRMSILPSQLPLEGSRLESSKTTEVDNDLELKLLYDEYLRAFMSEIIVKKRTVEKKNAILVELATLAKEKDHDREKLFKLQTRERDLMFYTVIENEIDARMVEENKFSKSKVMKTVHRLLSQLYSYLEPLDVLHCKNIVLPSTPKEWKQLERVVKACIDTSDCIATLIGSKGDAYRETYSSILEFIKSHSKIEDQLKGIEKPLCTLQALALKTASLTLRQDEEDTEEEDNDDDIIKDM